jgi:hypothetical protein
MLMILTCLLVASPALAAPLDTRTSLADLKGILSWKRKLTFDDEGKFKVSNNSSSAG